MPVPLVANVGCYAEANRFEREVGLLHNIIANMAARCACSSNGHGGMFSPWCVEHSALAVLFPPTPPPANRIGERPPKKF